jgi:hypothetical protein
LLASAGELLGAIFLCLIVGFAIRECLKTEPPPEVSFQWKITTQPRAICSFLNKGRKERRALIAQTGAQSRGMQKKIPGRRGPFIW